MVKVRIAILVWIVSALTPAHSLISPKNADIDDQDWMVDIYLQGSRSSDLYYFCKGSLIDEQWVLTSAFCFFDPFEVLSTVSNIEEFEFVAGFIVSGDLIPITNRFFSDDGFFVLLRLGRAAESDPLPLNFSTPAELEGETIKIYNYLESEALANDFFNPLGTIESHCLVNGVQFFDDGLACYIFTPLIEHLPLQELEATLIDPNGEDVPDQPAHGSFESFDTESARLYLDYREHESYTCYEDLGSPIVATIDGVHVQVGVVTAPGIISGMSLCNPSFANYFASVSELEDFITDSEARADFAGQCPAQPNLLFEKTGETEVHFHWNEIENADGYRVLFTQAVGYEPIQPVDLGTITEVTVNLDPTVAYTIALVAYNEDCSGQMSIPKEVLLEALDE